MNENAELNILVIENNYEHVAYARDNLRTTQEKLKFNFLGKVYPDDEQVSIKIADLADQICADRIPSDYLFTYIEELIDKWETDIILLDFFLSNTEETEENGRKPQNTTGAKLLEKIKNKYPEIPVVSYSKISHKIDTAPLTGSRILFHLDKDFTVDFFVNNLPKLFKMIDGGKNYRHIREKSSDIVVVCALASELKAILSLPLNWQEVSIDEKLYYRGYIGKFKVVATSEDKIGMPEAASLTTRTIDMFNPSFVVMTGIAAGIDSDQNFLDLLIPERIFNWQSGKYMVKEVVSSDSDQEKITKDLHIFKKDHRSVATHLDNNNTFNLKKNVISEKILQYANFDSFELKKPSKINIFSEGIVSGSAVVADKDIVNEKIEGRKIYGIDMEAYGVVFACNNHPSQPKPIIIKAISDFADKEKNDDVQPAAKHISAVAFMVLFEEIFLG